ncbi:MAG TPA: LysM peptidoglycan-binding domain-containing protein [Gaiellaceae bacterium]
MQRIGVALTAIVVAGLVFVGSASGGRYRVQWGDTLSGIAAASGTSVSKLAARNRLDPGGILVAGTVLRVPSEVGGPGSGAGGSYLVQPGDTLSAIAARYGTSIRAIARANGLSRVGFILAGSTLSIPGAAAASISAPGAIAADWTAEASINAWAAHYGVDPSLARAVAWMESGYQTDVVSSAGAQGVMQVTPPTWNYVESVLLQGRNVENTADGNVRIGVAFLCHLLRAFDGNERLALAAYYQGERSVRRIGILPESRRYVRVILSLKGRV